MNGNEINPGLDAHMALHNIVFVLAGDSERVPLEIEGVKFETTKYVEVPKEEATFDNVKRMVNLEFAERNSVFITFVHVIDEIQSDEEIQEIIAQVSVHGAGGCFFDRIGSKRISSLCEMTCRILGIDYKVVQDGRLLHTVTKPVVLVDEMARLSEVGLKRAWLATELSLVRATRQALQNRMPFSMVRLGHCEARFMGFQTFFTKNSVSTSTRMQWGLKDVPTPELVDLSRRVRHSAKTSDFIGVPKPNGKFGRFILLNNAIYSEAQAFELFDESKRFVSANVHWDLGLSDEFYSLLNEQRRIILITSRDVQAKLHHYLDTKFGRKLRRVEAMLLPAEFRRSYQSYDEPRYPAAFERILKALPEMVSPGVLVLVGAGIMGKIFCSRIRELGGVALDVGSLFDAWDGLNTRGAGFAEEMRLPVVAEGWSPQGSPDLNQDQPGNVESATSDQSTPLPRRKLITGAGSSSTGRRRARHLASSAVSKLRGLYRRLPVNIRRIVPRSLIEWINWQLDRAHRLPNPVAHSRQPPSRTPPLGAQPQYHTSTFNNDNPYKSTSLERLREVEEVYIDALHSRQNKANYAVYTAVTGEYEPVKRHESLMDDVDYFVFSEYVSAKRVGPYQIRPSGYWNEDSTRSARFVKLHPHTLLGDYQVAIWVDGNLLIRGDLSKMVADFIESGEAIGAVPHPLRSSVYEEAAECIRRRKDSSESIAVQMERYRAEDFDTDELAETNLILFNLQDPRLRLFLTNWWREVDRGSRRDQLSFNYALQASDLDYFKITEKPNSIRNHPDIALFSHNASIDDVLKLDIPPEDVSGIRNDGVHPRDRALREMAGFRIDVCICVHNALEDVKKCLASVELCRGSSDLRLIIVDDGSGEETSSHLQRFAEGRRWVDLYRNEVARGYTKSANQCIAASNAPFIIMLNSDTIVTSAWAEKLAWAAFRAPGIGIVGPLSNAASQQSIPDYRSAEGQTAINELPPLWNPERANTLCEEYSLDLPALRTPLAHGFCMGIRREVVEAIGKFDEERFPFGYGEENDYCFRAEDAGFSCSIALDTYVWHAKSRSFADDRRRVLVSQGNEMVQRLHGRARVARAIRSMQKNPALEYMRSVAQIHMVETQ